VTVGVHRLHQGWFLVALAVAVLDGCSSPETPTQTTTVAQEQPRRRRRRRRRRVPTEDSSPSSSFGSPTVSSNPRPTVRARLVNTDGTVSIHCELPEVPPTVNCPQCPLEPSPNTVSRAFGSAEAGVLNCSPPAESGGWLTVRAEFISSGDVREVMFPNLSMDSELLLCLGRALCQVHVPMFRAPISVVGHEYTIFEYVNSSNGSSGGSSGSGQR
jgi:hypothetical protein